MVSFCQWGMQEGQKEVYFGNNLNETMKPTLLSMHKHVITLKSQPICYLSAENVINEMVVCTFKHDVLHLSNVYVKLNVVHLRQNTTTQIKV